MAPSAIYFCSAFARESAEIVHKRGALAFEQVRLR